MSTLILVATGSVSGVIGAAAMFIPAKRLRDDAKTFMERGEETFDKAEHLAGEVERTRNMPWHYADEHVTGELIAVETHDLPALSAESHEDEQAADEDTDRPGAWAWLLATLIRPCSDLYDRIAAAYAGWLARRGSKDRLDGEEVPLADDVSPHRMGPIEEEATRRLVESHRATDAAIAEEIAGLTGEPVDVVIARREGHRYLKTGAFPLVKVTGVEGGRHRKAEVTIPAQRDGEVSA